MCWQVMSPFLLGEEAEASPSIERLNDVHAFGYNSAGSERVWMKFGELRVYCLELSLTNFWARSAQKRQWEGEPKFFFFGPLNNARFHRLPVGQISRNLHIKTCFRVCMWGFGKHLWKFARKGSFFPKKTSIFAWSKATISDFWPKF